MSCDCQGKLCVSCDCQGELGCPHFLGWLPGLKCVGLFYSATFFSFFCDWIYNFKQILIKHLNFGVSLFCALSPLMLMSVMFFAFCKFKQVA